MPSFFPLVRIRRKILEVVGGGNFRKEAPVSLAQSTRHEHGAESPLAVVDAVGPHEHRQPGPVALAMAERVDYESLTKQPAAFAESTGAEYAPAKAPQAMRVTRTRVDFTTRYYQQGTAGYEVDGDNDWTNVANFDGNTPAEAELSGGKGLVGLTPNGGGIRGTVQPPRASKDDATIRQVLARFYLRQTGTLLGNGTLSYGLEGSVSRVELGAQTGNVDQVFEHDVTALIGGDWGVIRSGLQFYVEGSSATLGRSCFARYGELLVISDAEEVNP